MTPRYFNFIWMICLCAAVLVPLSTPNSSLAAFGEDLEKPAPEFSREGNTVTAKLIPRAKSTSIAIDFSADPGRIEEVKGIEYESLQTPEVDIKEFKSDFFKVTVDHIPPGSEAAIAVSSPFFTISTEYWVYNPQKPVKWFDSGVKAEKEANDVNRFILHVRDGGDMDSDGAADGRITLIGGPRDYFWSYAIGTLLIRFFGIFLVLSMLMIGMLGVGKVFVYLEKKRAGVPVPSQHPPREAALPRGDAPAVSEIPADVDPDTVAAIATALYLHLVHRNPPISGTGGKGGQNSWVQIGRVEIHHTRTQTFQRPIHPGKHM